jgi:hypothetical protein
LAKTKRLKPGWWENLEAVHMIEIPENSKSLMRDDLLSDNGLLSRVVKHDKTGAEHRAVEEIRKFLRYRTERSAQRSQNGVLRPRIKSPAQEFHRTLFVSTSKIVPSLISATSN